MSPQVVEVIGYVASLLIVVSLAMRSVIRLRIVSLVGSLIFAVYGALIGAWPIIISNSIIVGLNVWNLRRELAPGHDLDAVTMDPASPFLADFLRTHLDDIRHSQPRFVIDQSRTAFVLMRDGMPAGTIMGNVDGEAFEVLLDYVLPAYRDLRLGDWFYSTPAPAVKAFGVTAFRAHPTTPVHTTYLKSVGFVADGDGMTRPAGSRG